MWFGLVWFGLVLVELCSLVPAFVDFAFGGQVHSSEKRHGVGTSVSYLVRHASAFTLIKHTRSGTNHVGLSGGLEVGNSVMCDLCRLLHCQCLRACSRHTT